MGIDVAIIGGTGVGSRLARLPGQAVVLRTAEGLLRGALVEFGGSQVLTVQRHSAGHSVPPHKVRYAAVALGLKALGVKYCFSTAAVGCLRPEWPVGTIVPCTDFIDASSRNLTLFNSRVVHTPMDCPFGARPTVIQQVMLAGGTATPDKVVYLQANGPRYETHAEIAAYRSIGADIVGMTAASEATVMKEAGISYECLAVVTNLAAGLAEVIEHGAVGDVMEQRGAEVMDILEAAVKVARANA